MPGAGVDLGLGLVAIALPLTIYLSPMAIVVSLWRLGSRLEVGGATSVE